jgi:DNA-binding response OmpR family regulator
VAALSVLLCSPDRELADLVTRNLARRGFRVRHEVWAACHAGPGHGPPESSDDVDLVIADLDCMGSASWQAIVYLRRLSRGVPVVFLAYEWPNPGRLGRCQPCGYLRKPFAMDELLRVVREFMPAAARRHRARSGADLTCSGDVQADMSSLSSPRPKAPSRRGE